ncbi:MAG: bifunctional diaminohydroxyphosphoribosylaminopyrimidine deaminase/5-amino-6-(5-phosphoribosylamino)uracil reductase RibD [Pseudobdellovibrionaceae bacterium]|nr:bifunctional diaminohydroxyphosphoribosylaminopyrimidine deaminase/5-amino-6-(5-phosphoribosylamino)uracil reductase RibD [Bdellovibrionales bacterium]USN47142.1 MAG: bifunctional diaminohydroxyphosphoribosylaminopyrimidine deaminase/5-amino-6-(5-phosphoribosylamino)uracil reductase RibD [Pseudobdellovibrionaceae bacterium]
MANKVDIPWGHDLTPDQAMTLAIKLAQMGKGHVEPNPPVGCVILNREGHLIGAGYHRKYGGDHAEVAALKSAASSNLDGAVIYVTLEPCAHHGKTPSCAKHIANLPVQKVIYGLQDPNPLVAGQGAKILSDAGVIAELWVGETDSLYDLVEMFFHNMIHKRAFVTLKVATSLDGFMGLQSGESQWITDEVARKYSHYLRAQHGGVAVGLGTYRHDNPSLDVRHEDYPDKKNTAVILDPLGESFKTLPHSKLASCHDEKDRWVVTGESAPQVAGPWQQITAPMSSHGEFDLIDLTKVLYDNGVHSVYVEGGAATYGSFLRQQAWNRLQLFMAPKIIGGNAGLGWTAETGADRLDDAWILEKSSIMDLGGDWLISGLSRQTLNDRKPI